MCKTIHGYVLFFAIALAIRANAAPPGCPAPATAAVGSKLGFESGDGLRGFRNVSELLASADAVVIGKMVKASGGRYGVLVDRVLMDKSGKSTAPKSFLLVKSCYTSHGYGLSFLKFRPDGTWASLNNATTPLPALARAPDLANHGNIKQIVAGELANVFTGTNKEVENSETGLDIDDIGGGMVAAANPIGDPSAPTKFLQFTPGPRSERGYSNALSTLLSIDKATVEPLLEAAYAQARAEKARMWLGMALLNYGDASKARPALERLMAADPDMPSLVSSFGFNADTLEVLRAVLPLQRSSNVQIRRAVAHGLLTLTHGDDTLSDSYQKSYVLPALINALEFDNDRDVRDWAMLGVCNISRDCEDRYPSREGDAYREGLRNPVIMASFIARAKTLIPADAPR